MRLRKKTLLIIGATLISLFLIMCATSQVILLSSFDELEERNSRQNLERVLNAMSDKLSDLGAFNYDWAAWDDTCEFIADGNDEYIESNLVDETFIGANLNFMMFLNSSDQVVFGKFFDLDNKTETPIPLSFLEHLHASNLLLSHNDTKSNITGVIILPEGPMLISSRPILTSEDEGPIRGTLIIGRYLDSAEIKYLSALTDLSLTAHRINDTQMPSDFQKACGSLSDEETTFIQPLSTESIAGYTLIKDIYGEPILVLRVDLPRDIYKQGQDTMRYFIISLLAVGLAFSVVSLLLLEKTVLSRLSRLSTDVSSIGKSGSLSARLSITGKDELSNLADKINGMLTALEQYQDKIRESEDRYRRLFNSGNDALFVYGITKDGMAGKFSEANDVACQRLGATREELLEQSPEDIVPPEKSGNVPAIMDKLLTDKHILFETEHVAKDGTRIPVEVNAQLFYLRGEPMVLSIARDITERKRADAALREVHERLVVTLKSIGDGVIATDIKGKIALMNGTAQELTGWKIDEAFGQPSHEIFNIINEATRTPIEDPIMKVLRSGNVVGLGNHSVLIAKDGTERAIADSGAPITAFDGTTIGVVLVFRDVTEKRKVEEERKALINDLEDTNRKLEERAKELEDAREATINIAYDLDESREKAENASKQLEELTQKLERSNKDLEDFVYIVSHDLKAPVRRISAFGDLLKESLEGRLDEDERENFEFMINGAARMQQLINDLLLYSRVHTKAKPMARVDLNEVVEDLRNVELATELEEVGGVIEVPEPLPAVHADPSQMHQLLQNLIGNGLKYHRDGVSPVVTIRGKTEGNEVRIEIKDNGIGISDAHFEKIFMMFQRLHTDDKGTGVGLAVCKRIVERHGGEIGVESTPGEGSRFWFTMQGDGR